MLQSIRPSRDRSRAWRGATTSQTSVSASAIATGGQERQPELAAIDRSLALAVEKPEALAAHDRARQSLSNSLMPVLARVCASTVLTITAQ